MTRSMTICGPWDADTVARSWAARYGSEPISGRVSIYIAATVGGPDSFAGKSKDGAFEALWPLVSALNGVAYGDDRHISDAGISQTWGEADSLTISVGPAFARAPIAMEAAE